MWFFVMGVVESIIPLFFGVFIKKLPLCPKSLDLEVAKSEKKPYFCVLFRMQKNEH